MLDPKPLRMRQRNGENRISTQLETANSGNSPDCVWVDIVIKGKQLTVNPSLMELLLQQYPTLPQHACKSGTSTKQESFGDHIAGALLPHVVEHICIDILVTECPGQAFAGNTSWIARKDQMMRVRVSLPKGEDHESAVYRVHGALSEAIEQINRLLAMC